MGGIRHNRWGEIPFYTQITAGRSQCPVIKMLKHRCLSLLMLNQSHPDRVQAQAGTGQDVIHFFTRNGQSVTRLRFGRFTGAGGSVLRSAGSASLCLP